MLLQNVAAVSTYCNSATTGKYTYRMALAIAACNRFYFAAGYIQSRKISCIAEYVVYLALVQAYIKGYIGWPPTVGIYRWSDGYFRIVFAGHYIKPRERSIHIGNLGIVERVIGKAISFYRHQHGCP